MAQIDFYLLPTQDNHEKWIFCCKLIEKAFRLGHRILIAVDNKEDAIAFDKLLWSYKPESFVPHRLIGDSRYAETPIEISFSDEAGEHQELLLNLSRHVPSYFQRFSRISEFVTEDENTKKESRERYRFYKEQGHSIDTRPIEAKHLR